MEIVEFEPNSPIEEEKLAVTVATHLSGTVKGGPKVLEINVFARENTFESNLLLAHLGVWLLD